MELSDCIVDYLDYVKHELKLSPLTHEHYQSRLRNFLHWLEENGYPSPTIETLNANLIRRYQYSHSAKGSRPRTIRGYMHSIRGLCAYLFAHGAIPANPALSVKLPKLDAAHRTEVVASDVNALFLACERQLKPRQIALSRAVLSVLVYGGLRREELCDLTLDCYNRTDKSLLIRHGKGDKSRQIYLCDQAGNAIEEWLALREKNCKTDHLFMLDKARRVHQTGIARLVETLKAAAGLSENEAIKPHGLRHFAATLLMRNGCPLSDIKAFLGHSSEIITANYLHSNEHQLRQVANYQTLPSGVSQKAPEVPKTASQNEEARRNHKLRVIRRGV